MNMKKLAVLFAGIGFAVMFNRCSETTQPVVHPVDWMDTTSDDFHGRQLLTEGLDGIDYCRSCHGPNLNGGNSGVSCDKCHALGFSGHPGIYSFMNVDSSDHHGRFFYNTGMAGTDYCKNCHGTDLTGGFTGFSCFACHAGGPNGHPAASQFLEDITSNRFHGNDRNWEGGTTHCMNCHGEDLNGGVAEYSCRECHSSELPVHTHDPGYLDISSPLFHASDYTWEEETGLCIGCHGSDLDGGISQFSCRDCHNTTLPVHTHDPGFIIYGDNQFHGATFDWDIDCATCSICHGDDLDGGSAQYTCRTCHSQSLPYHTHEPSFMDYSSNEFHGVVFDWDADNDLCKNCHGDNLDGGPAPFSCRSCHTQSLPTHTHDPGFMIYGNPGFHGDQLNWEADTPNCQGCHGSDLNGGMTGFSCGTCHTGELPYHAHGPSAIDPFSADYHGKILWNNGWDFSACEKCHGTDLDGGFVNVSCTTSCHQEQNGLGYCANCHGDRATGNPAPPLSIMNSNDPGSLSVGAHVAHLNSSIAVITCDDCHVVPADYLDPGHLGSDNRGDVTIKDDFAYYQVMPEYDDASGTCSNTYCHGGFSFPKATSQNQWIYQQDQITGNNQSLTWNDPQSMTCVSCHNLPPTGHLDNGLPCIQCHASVVNGALNIVNPSLHINGQINRN